jgi:hypothetical protein
MMRKPQPITITRIDAALDHLSLMMVRMRDTETHLPLWKQLNAARLQLIEEDAIRREIAERADRERDREWEEFRERRQRRFTKKKPKP